MNRLKCVPLFRTPFRSRCKRGRGERGDQLFQMEAEAAVGKRVEEGEAEIKPCIMYPSEEGGGIEGGREKTSSGKGTRGGGGG